MPSYLKKASRNAIDEPQCSRNFQTRQDIKAIETTEVTLATSPKHTVAIRQTRYSTPCSPQRFHQPSSPLAKVLLTTDRWSQSSHSYIYSSVHEPATVSALRQASLKQSHSRRMRASSFTVSDTASRRAYTSLTYIIDVNNLCTVYTKALQNTFRISHMTLEQTSRHRAKQYYSIDRQFKPCGSGSCRCSKKHQCSRG